MSARSTNLSVTAITLGATPYLSQAVDGTVALNLDTEDGRGMGSTQAIARAVAVKQRAEANVTILRDQSSARITPLDLTVLTFGATNELGNMTSLTIDVAVDNEDGAAAADRWAFANYLGCSLSIRGRLLANSTAPASRAAITGALSATALTVTATMGAGNSIAIPSRITKFSQVATRQAITAYDVEFESNGTAPTITGFPLLDISVGNGVVAPATFTFGDGGSLSGNWLITAASVAIDNGQITREQYTLLNRGAITLT